MPGQRPKPGSGAAATREAHVALRGIAQAQLAEVAVICQNVSALALAESIGRRSYYANKDSRGDFTTALADILALDFLVGRVDRVVTIEVTFRGDDAATAAATVTGPKKVQSLQPANSIADTVAVREDLIAAARMAVSAAFAEWVDEARHGLGTIEAVALEYDLRRSTLHDPHRTKPRQFWRLSSLLSRCQRNWRFEASFGLTQGSSRLTLLD